MEEFSQYFLQLVIGLQSTVWISLGKVANPMTGKVEIDLDRARDAIDTLIMLKEKTKNNLNQIEQGLLENGMADLELNYVEVVKLEKNKEEKKKEDKKEEKQKEKIKKQ